MHPLIAVSRPRFWFYVLGPALVGLIVAPEPLLLLTHVRTLLALLSWTLPANLFLYGINDVCDHDTDTRNAKKGTYEIRLQHSQHRSLLVGIGLSGITIAASAVATGSRTYVLWTILFLALAVAYSAPPLRLKRHPVVDSLSNVLYILPGFAMASLSGLSPTASIVIGGWSWSAAMHLFSAIPDIEPDAASHLRTTAVVVGHRRALQMTAILWTIAAVSVWFVPELRVCRWLVIVYPVLSLMLLTKPESAVFKAYRWMPLLNASMGFILFWDIYL